MKKSFLYLAFLLLFCETTFAGVTVASDKLATSGTPNDESLSLKMFELTGTREISSAVLNWKIITTEMVDYFEIERSVNDGAYITIAAIHQSVYLNELQILNYTDNIYGITAEKFTYRVKIISLSNKTKYSNVSVIHQSQLKHLLAIAPNQAKDYVNVGFYSAKNTTVEIKVLNSEGKKIYVQKQPAYLGNNTVKLLNLGSYPEGQYTIQIKLNGETTSGKLMLFTY